MHGGFTPLGGDACTLFHGMQHVGGPSRNGANQPLDAVAEVSRAVSQSPDFLRHGGEALAFLAGLGRLDGGVEGQNLSLPRQASDEVDNLLDLFAAALERFDAETGTLCGASHREQSFCGTAG